MRGVRLAALLTACGCHPQAPGLATPFARAISARTLAGIGGVPGSPADDRRGAFALTTEIGRHPFQESGQSGAAFGTGFSLSSATDLNGRWAVVALGPFAKVDLTYLLLTGLWAYPVDDKFPLRLNLGERIGAALSQSAYSRATVPYGQPYVLVRPEVEGFLDLEIPLCPADRVWSFLTRVALDNSVNLSTLFRWSVSVGLDYGWDP